MAHIEPTMRRFGAAALSIVLAFSMPGTAAFAGNMTEIAAETQAQTHDNEAEIGGETAAEEGAQLAEEGAAASESEVLAEETSPADEAATSAQSQDEQGNAVAIDAAESDADAQQARDARVASAGDVVTVSSADELPTTIEAGAVVKLAADISLEAGQQIESIAGTLDGQGHSIALNGKALAKSVTGVVQNLGVTGSIELEDTTGAIAEECSGVIQMCWSTAVLSGPAWSFIDNSGIVGVLNGGHSSQLLFCRQGRHQLLLRLRSRCPIQEWRSFKQPVYRWRPGLRL